MSEIARFTRPSVAFVFIEVKWRETNEWNRQLIRGGRGGRTGAGGRTSPFLPSSAPPPPPLFSRLDNSHTRDSERERERARRRLGHPPPVCSSVNWVVEMNREVENKLHSKIFSHFWECRDGRRQRREGTQLVHHSFPFSMIMKMKTKKPMMSRRI